MWWQRTSLRQRPPRPAPGDCGQCARRAVSRPRARRPRVRVEHAPRGDASTLVTDCHQVCEGNEEDSETERPSEGLCTRRSVTACPGGDIWGDPKLERAGPTESWEGSARRASPCAEPGLSRTRKEGEAAGARAPASAEGLVSPPGFFSR